MKCKYIIATLLITSTTENDENVKKLRAHDTLVEETLANCGPWQAFSFVSRRSVPLRTALVNA